MHYITIDLNFAKFNYYVYDGVMIAKYKAFMSHNEGHGPKRKSNRAFFRVPESHPSIICLLNEGQAVEERNVSSFVICLINLCTASIVFFFLHCSEFGRIRSVTNV